MKTFTLALLVLAGFTQTQFAGPVTATQIPDTAKWVAHLDLDQLQHSKLGESLAKQWLDPQLGAMADKVHAFLGVDLDWHKIHSITAYGTNLKKKPDVHSVLLIQSELPLNDLLKAAQKKLTSASPESEAMFRKISQEQGDLFAVGQDAFLSIAKDNLLVLGRSQRVVSNAVATLQGKTKPLSAERSWVSRSASGTPFLTVGLTEGFQNGLQFPAQAKVLEMTDGAQLSLGEAGEDIVAKLSLRAKNESVVDSLQQALQGVLAIASLSTLDQPDLQSLVQGLKVERSDKDVDVALRYPVGEMMKWLQGKKSIRAAQR